MGWFSSWFSAWWSSWFGDTGGLSLPARLEVSAEAEEPFEVLAEADHPFHVEEP